MIRTRPVEVWGEAKFRDREGKSKVLIRYSEVGQGFNPLRLDRPGLRPDISIKPKANACESFESVTATRILVTSFLRSQIAHVPASIHE